MSRDLARTSPLLLAALLMAPGTPAQDKLGAPVRIEAADAPIDVTVGHAAPFVRDMDGDGVRDLLVGEFGTGRIDGSRMPPGTLAKWGDRFAQGKLRIYRNVGTDENPVFDEFDYMQAGGEDASIPTT